MTAGCDGPVWFSRVVQSFAVTSYRSSQFRELPRQVVNFFRQPAYPAVHPGVQPVDPAVQTVLQPNHHPPVACHNGYSYTDYRNDLTCHVRPPRISPRSSEDSRPNS